MFGALSVSQKAYLDSLGNPKAGAMVMGPLPPEGMFPPYKGAPGPKQQKCAAAGGVWTGPATRKFCVMVPPPMMVPRPAPPPALPGYPPVYPGAQTRPPVVPPPIMHPPGYVEPTGPATSTLPGTQEPLLTPIEDEAISDMQSGAMVMSSKSQGPAKTSTATLLILGVAVGGLLYFVAKAQKKKGR